MGRRPIGEKAMTTAERQRRHREGIADKAGVVVKRGIPELVAAMHREDISIDAAALIAREPPERQRRLVRMAPAKRAAAVKGLGYRKARAGVAGRRFRKVTIPWSAQPAVTLLLERWPASLLLEFQDELMRRIASQPWAADSSGERA